MTPRYDYTKEEAKARRQIADIVASKTPADAALVCGPGTPVRGIANEHIAETIVTAIECRFRDWLMSGEHAEAVALVTEILNDKKPDRA